MRAVITKAVEVEEGEEWRVEVRERERRRQRKREDWTG
jgi:hypothetical protein